MAVKTLDQLIEDIKTAEELVRKAREDYEAGVLELLREGKLVEKKISKWHEVVSEHGRRVYCEKCRAVFGTDKVNSWHSFCPACGASMANAARTYRYEPVVYTGFTDNTTAKDQASEKPVLKIDHAAETKELKGPDYIGDARVRAQVNMIEEFIENGVSFSQLRNISGIPNGSLYRMKDGRPQRKEENYSRLCKTYKDYFGHDYVLK